MPIGNNLERGPGAFLGLVEFRRVFCHVFVSQAHQELRFSPARFELIGGRLELRRDRDTAFIVFNHLVDAATLIDRSIKEDGTTDPNQPWIIRRGSLGFGYERENWLSHFLSALLLVAMKIDEVTETGNQTDFRVDKVGVDGQRSLKLIRASQEQLLHFTWIHRLVPGVDPVSPSRKAAPVSNPGAEILIVDERRKCVITVL